VYINQNEKIQSYDKLQTIFIIGYYNHSNLGDEQYKQTFSYILYSFFFNTYKRLFNKIYYNIRLFLLK
jgi:hypothetical protein